MARSTGACPHCGYVLRPRHAAALQAVAGQRVARRRRWALYLTAALALAAAIAVMPNVRLFPPRVTRVHAADVVAWDRQGEPLRIRCPSCYGTGVRQVYTSMGMRLFPCDACQGRRSVPVTHFYRVEVVRGREPTIYDQMAGHRRW